MCSEGRAQCFVAPSPASRLQGLLGMLSCSRLSWNVTLPTGGPGVTVIVSVEGLPFMSSIFRESAEAAQD